MSTTHSGGGSQADAATQSPEFKVDVYLGQYTAYLSDLGNVGSRYATVSGFYVSVVSALLGLLAIGKAKLFGTTEPNALIEIVALFASLLCANWARTIWYYHNLFEVKFEVLKRIEKHLPVHCFGIERCKIKEGFTGHTLTAYEAVVPLLLCIFFAVIFVMSRTKG
jgi:hypothetical protein